MNGNAPYWSATGSQVPDTRNRAPNFRSAGIDSRRRTAKSSAASARTTKAKNAEAFSNARSFGLLPVFGAIRICYPLSFPNGNAGKIREGGEFLLPLPDANR